MGLFGPSKSELADRIDELENKLDEARDEADTAHARADIAYDRAGEAKKEAKQNAQTAAEIAHALHGMATNLPQVESLNDEVETLDEPHIAYKATENYIVELVLPAGTTVVHPYGTKKRCDQAIVTAFYNADRYGVEDAPALETQDHSKYDWSFDYNIGEKVTPEDALNTDSSVECESGIHFWRTKDGALHWL